MVLIHISDANEMISDAEYLFICLLIVCMSAVENCLLISFAHFKNQFFLLLSLNCLCSLYIMDWLACKVAQSCPALCNPISLAYQVPLSMEFSRQEYWSGLPFPSPEGVPNQGIKPGSPALQADTLPSENQGSLWTLWILTPYYIYDLQIFSPI